jgi:nucleotide-binding universal stress UspA family protein
MSFSSRTNNDYYNDEIDTNKNANIIKEGEAKKDIEDVVSKVKAGGTAVAKKVFDTDKDLETEYQNAKTENKTQYSSNTKVQRSPKEILTANTPQYKKILVPHDGSEASDKALAHAIYLSKISKAEIFILNAVEDLHEIAPTTISASPKPTEKGTARNEVETTDNEPSFASSDYTTSTVSETTKTKTQTTVSDKNLDVAIKGRLIDMIQERIALCKEAGVESNVSYKIQTGKAPDSIVNLAKEVKADLIIMVSEKLGSSIKGIMSNTRKVIDAVEIPVVVLSG